MTGAVDAATAISVQTLMMAGLRQAAIAKSTGLSQQTISRYEMWIRATQQVVLENHYARSNVEGKA